MKKISLVTVILIFCYISASSQSCLPEGIEFTTQSQIDSFQILHPNCTEIEGDVEIYEGYNITNLNGLNLVTSIGGYLYIAENYALTSLTGLDNVTSIGGWFDIWGNTALINLTGLEGLTSIGQHFAIFYNSSMTSLTGLDNLTSIGAGLYIEGNVSLTSLTGLENMTSIGEDFTINYNTSLTNLTGLNNLTSIGGWFGIEENASLTSLTGLDSIDAGSITNLYICYNESLSTCEVQSVCDYLADPNGTIEIHDNATGCNSPVEVQDSCEANGVNIDEPIMRDEVILYPNPAHQELNLSADGITIDEVVIYTLTGQQVMHERPGNGTKDISHLQPGMYIVEVMVEDRKIRQKLLVQR